MAALARAAAPLALAGGGDAASALASSMPTSLATWIAVSAASPVSMCVEWPDSTSAPMTCAESLRTYHTQA